MSGTYPEQITIHSPSLTYFYSLWKNWEEDKPEVEVWILSCYGVWEMTLRNKHQEFSGEWSFSFDTISFDTTAIINTTA